MNEQLHIIITGESGKTLRLPLSRKNFLIYSISAVSLLAILALTSVFSVSLFTSNRLLSRDIAKLQAKVSNSDALIAQIKQEAESERSQLSQQVIQLKQDKESQLAALREEKDLMLSTAVSELNERSVLIENIMGNIGIKIDDKSPQSQQNSGGPFIEHAPGLQDELLHKTDTYLKAIKSIPLGRPVSGAITSRFGPRKDPVNSRSSFHEGIDFRGKRGEKIYATADGVVTRAFRNGSYGNFVEINHRNGYTTSFAHMQKFVVKKGDKIKRGQLIGMVGNTGRSTGPHLHYELLYKGKPINPMKFMQIAKLIKPLEPVKVVKPAKPKKIVQPSGKK